MSKRLRCTKPLKELTGNQFRQLVGNGHGLQLITGNVSAKLNNHKGLLIQELCQEDSYGQGDNNDDLLSLKFSGSNRFKDRLK